MPEIIDFESKAKSVEKEENVIYHVKTKETLFEVVSGPVNISTNEVFILFPTENGEALLILPLDSVDYIRNIGSTKGKACTNIIDNTSKNREI